MICVQMECFEQIVARSAVRNLSHTLFSDPNLVCEAQLSSEQVKQ